MYDPSIFRMYDIRGVAGSQLSADVARGVARALGTLIKRKGGSTAAVGRDVRLSSPSLADAVAEGLASTGLDVFDLGQVPTPVVYHALHRHVGHGGIMVTGSHNPKEYNGLKLCLGTASLYGDQIQELLRMAEEEDFAVGEGNIFPTNHLPVYLDEIAARFSLANDPLIVADTGNGVMGPVVKEAMQRAGATCIPLYFEPDGDFPNHIPDPEVEKYMAELGRTVVEEKALCGLGFDGDGDRVGVFDETGRKISADWLVALFARDVLKLHPGGKIRYDVKCSSFLDEDILNHGGVPVMGVTGHSLLKRDIKQMDCVLGGELSGHIVFNREFVPTDDSLYCALRFLELLEKSGGKASELFADFPALVSTAEIKLPCADAVKFKVVEELVTHLSADHEVIVLDGARVVLEDGAWFLVRASNTTPVLTVRLEARTKEALRSARDILLEALAPHASVETAPLREAVV